LPTSSHWTAIYDPGTYFNNGVTLTLGGFPNNGFPQYILDEPAPYLGTPAFVLWQPLSTNTVATFELDNIPDSPAGYTYDLVLYSDNSSANAGTTFALTIGSGTADQGISQTINAPDPGQTTGPNNIFREGANYVLFDNVIPANGTLAGTGTPLSTEADLNAIQLVAVSLPEPTTLSIAAIVGASLFARRRPRN